MKSIKFNYLIKNYKQDIIGFRFICLKINGCEDITQEVLIKTWETLKNLNSLKLNLG
jgi:hypothetical protein